MSSSNTPSCCHLAKWALTPDFEHWRRLDIDGPSGQEPHRDGNEGLSAVVQGGRGRAVPVEPGATIKSVTEDVGVNNETLRKWIRADHGRCPGSDSTPPAASAPAQNPVEAELAAARKQIRELEEERDILRKAARHLAGETRW